MLAPRRTATLFAVGLAVSLAFAGDALAKGPDAATITGPGLTTPLTLNYRTPALRQTMQRLTTDGDFFRQAFGPTTSRARPASELGPRYVVVYRVPGPNGNSWLRQALYPYATRGAVTNMTRGQRFWGTRRTRGGWSPSSPALTAVLVAAGLPAATD